MTITLIIGILAVAAVSTIGDYLWYEVGVPHRMTFGIAHGALLLGSVGAVIGALSRKPIMGALAGAIAGIGGALLYYAVVTMHGRMFAMLAGWTAVWLLLAIFDARAIRSPRGSWSGALARGVVAALLAGAGFYLVLGVLWGRPPAGGRNYLLQYGAWLVAWAPGLVSLALRARR
jgi:energy-converting hydrogenase Eha subunit E